MEKNYIVLGVVIVLIGLVFWFGSEERPAPQSSNEKTPAAAPAFHHAHGIAVDAEDASRLYIATHEGLLTLSDTGELSFVGETRDDLMGFSTHRSESRTFFSSGHPKRGGNIGFQKTTDGGMTWETLSLGLDGPVDFHSMTVSQANSNIVYGHYKGKLQRSVDGGKTFEYAKGAVMPISLATDAGRENVVFAATQSGVAISEDAGESWRSLSVELDGGVVTTFALAPHGDNRALVFAERLGGMGKSTDGGKTWEKVPETFNNEIVQYLSFSKGTHGVVYALTDKNSVYKSIDSGDTWSRVN